MSNSRISAVVQELESLVKSIRDRSSSNLSHAEKVIAQKVKEHANTVFADHPTKGQSLHSLSMSERGGDKAYKSISVIGPDGSTRVTGKVLSSETNLRRKNGQSCGVGEHHGLLRHVSEAEHEDLKNQVQQWNSANPGKVHAHAALRKKAQELKNTLRQEHNNAGGTGLSRYQKSHIENTVNQHLGGTDIKKSAQDVFEQFSKALQDAFSKSEDDNTPRRVIIKKPEVRSSRPSVAPRTSNQQEYKPKHKRSEEETLHDKVLENVLRNSNPFSVFDSEGNTISPEGQFDRQSWADKFKPKPKNQQSASEEVGPSRGTLREVADQRIEDQKKDESRRWSAMRSATGKSVIGDNRIVPKRTEASPRLSTADVENDTGGVSSPTGQAAGPSQAPSRPVLPSAETSGGAPSSPIQQIMGHLDRKDTRRAISAMQSNYDDLDDSHINSIRSHANSDESVMRAADLWEDRRDRNMGIDPTKNEERQKRRAERMKKSENIEMDMASLVQLLHHIRELQENLEPGDKLPDWVSAKLTIAADYLSSVSHYVDGKKQMGSPLNKIAQLEKALRDLKKEDPYWNTKKPVNQIARENQKATDKFRQERMGVGLGSGPNVQISSAPRVSGIAKEYQMGTTKSGKPIMSMPDHAAHGGFSEADHGQASAMHKQLRDELRQDRGANPKLAEHHHNAAEYHSKMQAKLRTGG